MERENYFSLDEDLNKIESHNLGIKWFPLLLKGEIKRKVRCPNYGHCLLEKETNNVHVQSNFFLRKKKKATGKNICS